MAASKGDPSLRHCVTSMPEANSPDRLRLTMAWMISSDLPANGRGRPIDSSGLHPKMRSAVAFQLVTFLSRSRARMARGEAWITASSLALALIAEPSDSIARA